MLKNVEKRSQKNVIKLFNTPLAARYEFTAQVQAVIANTNHLTSSIINFSIPLTLFLSLSHLTFIIMQLFFS